MQHDERSPEDDQASAPGLTIEAMPDLRQPIMLCSFAGWNDAGETATGAVAHLARVLDARRFAQIEPEEYYVFTEVRPTITLIDGEQRRLDWPANEFLYAYGAGNRPDLVLLQGIEPQLAWHDYTDAVLRVARLVRARIVILLGALLADVPYTRPVRFTGMATHPRLLPRWEQLGARRSRYEGPTGIVGVLSDRLRRAGMPLASLWANVPHYINASPNPRTLAALVRQLDTLLDLGLDLSDLEARGEQFDRQVDEAIAQNPEVRAYIRQLEQAGDGDEEPEPASDLPTPEAILAELEEFLREQRQDDDDDDS